MVNDFKTKQSKCIHKFQAKRQLYTHVSQKLIFKTRPSDRDLSGSPKIKYFYFFRKPMCHFIMVFCCYELSISLCLRDIQHVRIRLVTLTFQVHHRSNIFYSIKKPICHFIMVFCWYEPSISYRLRDIPRIRFRLVTLTFQGHQRSNILTFLESSYVTLEWCFCWYQLSLNGCEIFRI